jgi:hypothetical protein
LNTSARGFLLGIIGSNFGYPRTKGESTYSVLGLWDVSLDPNLC